MAVQEVVLILMVVFSFCSPASLASVSKNLVSGNTHENMGNEGIGEDSDSINGSGNGLLVKQSKFVHGAGATAAAGSRSHGGEGDNGNGGQSQGGTAVIPVYSAGAAAAAAQRNHHRAAGTCTRCFKGGLPVLFAATLASMLLHISV